MPTGLIHRIGIAMLAEMIYRAITTAVIWLTTSLTLTLSPRRGNSFGAAA